jgi:hypothetical protein
MAHGHSRNYTTLTDATIVRDLDAAVGAGEKLATALASSAALIIRMITLPVGLCLPEVSVIAKSVKIKT